MTLVPFFLLACGQADISARLMTDVKFLASDELEGRSFGPGLDKAASYIADQFKKAKLTPGNGKSWLQECKYTDSRTQTEYTASNVIGILPGSDKDLKNHYVLVTAHYDHLGKREGEGDQIYNGANDDASGTAGVMEVARLLKKGKAPRRTIVFMCFWGEERGLRGSRAYAENPVFPLKDTDANINLEQIGRTDDSEGPRVKEFNLTGFEYSNMADMLRAAAEPLGIKVTGHPKLSKPYFRASDNFAFANKGIPAHTISVAYEFPDYHRPGDHWDKLDYSNMGLIVKAIAAGVQSIANADAPIQWKAEEPGTKAFIEAQAKLKGG